MTETHTPLVSVIVPTFNQKPEYLRATIRSVLAQDFDDFELVVSDNHSIAETAAVMNEFDDERLHVVHPPEHLPMIPHFSFAAEQGRGKYLSFLPSDDLVEPDWLSTLVPAIERDEDASFAFGEIMGVVHDAPETVLYTCRDNKLASGTYDPEFLLKLIVPLDRTSGWLIGDLIRSDIYRDVGGMSEDGVSYGGDHALALKLITRGNAVYVNKPVGRHRVWRTDDGKVDANRGLATISDIVSLYDAMERSPPLQPILSRVQPELATAKRRNARHLALVTIEALALDTSERPRLSAYRDKICTLEPDVATRALLYAAQIPFALDVVKLLRSPARRLLRR